MSIALLIIDMQKEFREMEPCKEMVSNALEYINEVSSLFREAGKPVIVIQDEEAGDGPGSEGYELMDDLDVMESDIHLSKIYSNSFWKTDLERTLKDLDVEFVVVSGFAAEHCVLFTYNGAIERGFGASILQHGIAGLDKSRVKDTQDIRAVISYEALKYILKNIN